MVDERYEGQEEGEYHFSDDEVAYDAEHEATKVPAAAVTAPSPSTSMSRYKRMLIVVVIFIALMFIIYKMLVPSSFSPPNTDISQQVTAPPVVNKTTVATTTKTTTTSAPPMQAANPSPQPMIQEQPQAQNVVSAAPAVQVPTVVPAPASEMNVSSAPPPVMTQQVSSAPPSLSQSPPSGVVTYAQSEITNKDIVDKLAALDQQNAKLANLLQIEYAQKMSDYENQSVALQAKLRDLSSRVANIETALNQITQLLQGTTKQISMSPSSGGSSTYNGPKQNYTVQAIIPGRAWLKSDAGDTITVAEGDVLRDYGRITKIDPYDGVVDIDTGNKIISLSYGSGGDS